MHVDARINRACDEERFELYFQPIVPIRHGVEATRQFELLLRMRDETGNLVLPNEFIPAAERFNLMPAIDRWVVRQACRTLAHRRADRCHAGLVLRVRARSNSLMAGYQKLLVIDIDALESVRTRAAN